MAEEWGPWIDHDGKGCPVAGRRVHIVLGVSDAGHHPDDDPQEDWHDVEAVINGHEAIAIARPNPSWFWGSGWYPIVSYRVQRPRALLDLIELVENLPALREVVPA